MEPQKNHPLHEKLLVYRLADQDADAFAELYDNYAPRIYRYLYFKLATAELAEDLTSQVFLKTWQYVQEGNRIDNFRAFVYQLARNATTDHYRSKAAETVTMDTDMLTAVAGTTDNSLFASMSQASDLDTIQKCLPRIRDEYHDLIILRYVEGYGTAEVAKILDKSKGAVRVSLHRALEQLKTEVNKLEQNTSSTNHK